MTFSSDEKIKTTFGGLSSILFCLFVCWAVYNESQNLIFKKNPQVIVTQSFSQNPRLMVLTPENFPVAFFMQTPDSMGNVQYVDDDIYTIQLMFQHITSTTNPDGTQNIATTLKPIDLEPCTLAHFGTMATSFQSMQLDKMLCIATQQTQVETIQIQGSLDSLSGSDGNYEALMVLVQECDDTVAGNTCKPQSVRQTYLSGGWFYTMYTNMVVDSKNYTDPNSRFRDIYYTVVNYQSYKNSYVELGHVNVTTDSGWFVEDSTTQSYVSVSGTKEYIQNLNGPDNTLLSVQFEVAKLEQVYTRSYDKIQNILADVGGIISPVFFIILIALGPYTKLKLRESLMNELFNIYTGPESKGKMSKSVDNIKAQDESIHLKTAGSSTPPYAKASSIRTIKEEAPIIPIRNVKSKIRTQLATDSPGSISSRNVLKEQTPNSWREGSHEHLGFNFGTGVTNDPYIPKRQEIQSSRRAQVAPSYPPALAFGLQSLAAASKQDITFDLEAKSPVSVKKKEGTVKIHITFLQYLSSFIYKTKAMKKKMELVENGVKSINERLDVINVMKKLREVDKLKALVLDDNQFQLFNHLPKPEIRPKDLRRLSHEKAFVLGLLASLKFIDDEEGDMVHNAHQRIMNKPEMTEIDRKLLEIFEKKRR